MVGAVQNKAWRFFLALVLLFQAAAPGLAAAAAPSRIDVSALICAPSGHVSNEAIAALQEIIDSTQNENTGDVSATGPCHFCLSQIELLRAPLFSIGAHEKYAYLVNNFYCSEHLEHVSFGSPLGVRAAPLS